MKKTLKIIVIIAILGAMIFGLTGCGTKEEGKTNNATTNGNESLVNKVGDTIDFGTFDKSPITWQAIAVDLENNKALLISKDVLFEKKYHEISDDEVTWETSTLRAYLNGEFFTKAFTSEQAKIIIEAKVAADNNNETKISGGKDTIDKVFILSANEIKQYFSTQSSRSAFLKGTEDGFDYWARTPGCDLYSAYIIRHDGGLQSDGYNAGGEYGVRPAIWVDITPKSE